MYLHNFIQKKSPLTTLHTILQEHDTSDGDIYNKLQEAMKEAENLKNEAYDEYCKRQKAEMNSVLALQKVSFSLSTPMPKRFEYFW